MLIILCCSCAEPENEVNTIKPVLAKAYQQTFESHPFGEIPKWRRDNAPYQGPFSDAGEYFQQKNIFPPNAYRNTIDIGKGDWLVAELYTRTEQPILLDYLDIVPDPSNTSNKVLKIATPDHTDGVVLRSKHPLPKNYRIKLRIGHAQYGDDTKLNGYDIGNETAEPWVDASSVGHNGFYWLAILDTEPKPHNNVWIHHHRKFVIDSWNRKEHINTVNVIALNGLTETHERFGKKFISYQDNKWKYQSDIPMDYYLPNEWYDVEFTRTNLFYQFSISGNFRYGGKTTYSSKIDFRKYCVFHYNQSAEEQEKNCVDNRALTFAGKSFPSWPINSAYADYFMLGEPHINYYEGSVLIDNISLEEL